MIGLHAHRSDTSIVPMTVGGDRRLAAKMGTETKVSPSLPTSNTSLRPFMPPPTCSDREATNSGMNYIHLTQTLVDSFNALADEVQILTDRKTILEHKLRFAHEQYQYLADKHAPAAPEISEVLAKLQLPPELANPSLEEASQAVPLPKRNKLDTRNQIALIIRDGRRVAQQLSSIGETSKTSDSSRQTSSREAEAATGTSMSTVLEQDFTIEGKKGPLECPFSAPKSNGDGAEGDAQSAVNGSQDPTPHHSADPICVAMLEESGSQPAANGSPAKCPIRYLDQHSPEEIAHYVETHKHELPRSHEVCVRRYQKNEVQIKKLDAKYGNLVNMIQGLSALHQPMLPSSEEEQEEIDRASNERVHNWAKAVTATASDDAEQSQPELVDAEEARQSHFDRPLKEVRVGESPSRPWGISVPVYEPTGLDDGDQHPPLSPPPAPVFMPTGSDVEETPAKTGKCPFDHTKLAAMSAAREEAQPSSPQPASSPQAPISMPNGASDNATAPKTGGKCPFDHAQLAAMGFTSPTPNTGEQTFVHPDQSHPSPVELPSTPVKPQPAHSSPPPQPAFINPPLDAYKQTAPGGVPQMVFTGPVFIGYPIEQAIQFMQHFQQGRQ
ncbi:hypothetical protein CkaCkLH20_02662 [Colletotrichum karsti]|uniref:Uncharacterized protein n=1 Tax=Colletotrichum karsti TaxID=1095194 RepID=A0A9P6IDI0_9PEZI|nr:uncharacterized protein CkaCkLH20_02662 [Colletotrichum karsti]KAF9879851.1 hypothetical protein CkaCkLH20_02662 [Colletotrichum karsti]